MSRKMDESEFDEYEEDIVVASMPRVIFGLFSLLFGPILLALSENVILKYLGVILFIISLFIMTTTKKRS